MAAKKQLMKPATQKVVKDAKPTEVEPRVISDEEYRCTCCGHKYKKQETNFGRSKSPIYKGNNGFVSICKNCVAELYEQYVKFYDGDEDAAAERICQITDMYFDLDIWASSRKISESRNGKSRNRISTYISRLNLSQVDGATTYSDTLVRRWEANVENAPTVEDVAKNDDIQTPEEVVRRFGVGFDAGDYACKEAILRPGSLIVVASATKKQARLIVSEKIAKEILPRSPLLQQEIKTIKDNQNDIEVKFNNGSSIVVLVANENVRGYRATVFIYEEFRMIVKSIIDTVLSPTLFQRQIPFRIKYPDEYKELKEEPKEIYISSAWYKSHWMWDYMKLVTRDMLGKGKSVLIGMDYSIALKHEIKTRDFLVKERKKLDRVAWTIEYENQMVAENAHAYFTYDMLNKNRVLKRPFYPRKNEDVLSKVKAKHTIPKQAGEIRIIACDIAPEGGTGNDNSVFTCIRALPESKEYKVSDTSGDHIEVKQGYRRQVVYMEPQAEFETTKQAIRIKQLFADFEADYCVLDTRNAGVAIYDALAKVLYDVDRNVEYEPWTCMNDDKLKARIVIAGQKEAVFSVKASLELNSKIAVSMRDSLNNRMIELMVSNQEGVEELQRLYPEYVSADVDTQLFYERPFLETVALINEMIGLEYTVQNQTNLIKIEERPGARKDRYTSVSYGNYFVSLLEADLFSDSSGYEYVTLCN